MQTLPHIDPQDTAALARWLFAGDVPPLTHTCPSCGSTFACPWDDCLCASGIDTQRWLCGPCTRRATRG